MKTYKKDFSDEELNQALHANDIEAAEIIDNPDKWESFREKVEHFMHEVYRIPVLGELVDDIVSMVQMADSYVKKEYTAVPLSSIISIIGALIYLLSPIDLIPDVIPVIGYADDAAVVLLVLRLGVGHDLVKYKLWQEQQCTNALVNLEKATGKIIADMLKDNYLGALVLSMNQRFQVLAVNNDSLDANDMPYITKVYYLSLPIDILKNMGIYSNAEYLAFLNHIIENTDFNWSPVGVLAAIHESEFDKYEDYFALVGMDDDDE